ncbi:hypothetical protein N9Z58_01970 [bacterium]|nr:hypothetical protein [bacterium]
MSKKKDTTEVVAVVSGLTVIAATSALIISGNVLIPIAAAAGLASCWYFISKI